MKSYLMPLLGLALLAPAATVLTAAPAAAQARTSVKIRLSGAPINAIRPEGSSEYRVEAARGRRSFRAEVNRVSLSDGTVLTVSVNGVPVGTLTLALGRGALELKTERRNAVPAIVPGDLVSVTAGDGSVVVSGRF